MAQSKGNEGFVRFPQLPAELRYMVWKWSNQQPGIHHVVLAADQVQEPDGHLNYQFPFCGNYTSTAHMEPMFFPISKDHLGMGRSPVTIDLMASCQEAKTLLPKSRSNEMLELSRGDESVRVNVDVDVVFLKYLCPKFEGHYLPFNTDDIQVPKCGTIRHLAARFRDFKTCHQTDVRCWCYLLRKNRCRKTDTALACPRVQEPHHVVDLLGLFPHLKTFYLVDDGITLCEGGRVECDDNFVQGYSRKVIDEEGRARVQHLRYYEIAESSDEWLVSSPVFNVLRWVRTNYVGYVAPPQCVLACTEDDSDDNEMNDSDYEDASKLEKRRHAAPETVEFKVLAPLWVDGPTAS